MAEERSAAGGRTPPPGESRGGATSAAAASRIKVDISDVTKLKTAIKDTKTEAKSLSDALAAFDTRVLPTLRKVRGELESMQRALGTSGVRSVGPKATPVSSGVGSANQHAGQMSGQAQYVGSGGSYTARALSTAFPRVSNSGSMVAPTYDEYSAVQVGMMGRLRSYLTTPAPTGTAAAAAAKPAWGSTPLFQGAVAALGGVVGLAELGAAHRGNATSRSYLLNTSQLLTGNDIGTARQTDLGRSLTGAMGDTGLSYADVTSAFGTLTTSGVMGGAYGKSRMASVGLLSAINPMQGNQVSAQQVASTFTSQNYYRMRLAGINASIASGQNIQTVFDQIIDRIEGQMGRRLTNTEIMSGLQQGTHLNANFRAMGLSDDMIPQIVQYWSSRRRTGQRGMAAVNASGARNNLAFQTQQAGAAQARAGANIDQSFIPGAEAGARLKGQEWNAVGRAAMNPAGQALGYAAGALNQFTGELGAATKALKWLVEAEVGIAVARGIGTIAGAGGATAGAGATASFFGRLGAAGSRTARFGRFAGTAGGAVAVGSAAVKMGGDVYNQVQQDQSSGASNFTMARHALGAAYSSAASQVKYAPGMNILDFVGSGLQGKGWHASKLVPAAAKTVGGWLGIGGSDNDPNLWGGSGQTYKMLERMAAKGPHEIVTSTTSGQHATGSYHYKGQAIDLTDKAGSRDSAGLLAINRYFAKNYGHKLAELIYAGPGGINIKDGKVVNGMSFYGASTMAGHHDHVHVAATPASLGMDAGGVNVDGQGNPRSAASSGGFSTPGGSPASAMSASSLLSGIFQSSSGDALIGALSGAMGGGGSMMSNSGGGGGKGRGGGNGSIPPAPADVHGAVATGKRMAAARGWTGRQWDALYRLWMNESGWRSNADNPTSDAYGIPQSLPGSKMASAGADWKTNPATQIKWGLNYISDRYHDPAHALQQWNARSPHWYEKGAWNVVRDEIAQLHKDEMVLPAGTAAKVRQLVENPHAAARQDSGGGGVRRVVPVSLVFQVMTGGEAEARRHASRFAKFVAEEHGIEMVASG